MAVIGVIAWVFSWIQIAFFSVFAENIAFKARVKYFQKALEKDAAYYDEHNPTEMASKISKEISAM